MKNQYTAKLVVVMLLALMWAIPVLAQEKPKASRKPRIVTKVIHGRTVTMAEPMVLEKTEANFNKYRDDVLAILQAQKATMIRMGIPYEPRLDIAIQEATALRFSDIKAEQPGFVDMTQLRASIVDQQNAVNAALTALETRRAQFAPSDPFPVADWASFCADSLMPQPPEVAYASGIALLIAEMTQQVAQNICDQALFVFGIGGNSKLGCIIPDIIYGVTRAIDWPIQQCHGDVMNAQVTGGFDRLKYLHDLLNFNIDNDTTNKMLLSTQMTNAENHVVTNDNNNKAALSGQLDAFQTLNLRMSIAANLAEDPATIAAVGSFETPASKGGYLELARQMVIDTYTAHLAAAGAGVTIYNPANELSLAATFTAQGKYREAYYYYRRAYRSIVKFP
jgi:hypothetical protein